jgi:hypothetical protein
MDDELQIIPIDSDDDISDTMEEEPVALTESQPQTLGNERQHSSTNFSSFGFNNNNNNNNNDQQDRNSNYQRVARNAWSFGQEPQQKEPQQQRSQIQQHQQQNVQQQPWTYHNNVQQNPIDHSFSWYHIDSSSSQSEERVFSSKSCVIDYILSSFMIYSHTYIISSFFSTF